MNKIYSMKDQRIISSIPVNTKFAILSFNVFIYVLLAHFCGPHKPVEGFYLLFSWYDNFVTDQLKNNGNGKQASLNHQALEKGLLVQKNRLKDNHVIKKKE